MTFKTSKFILNYILVHKSKELILFLIQVLTGCGYKMMTVQIAQPKNGIDLKMKKVPLSVRNHIISNLIMAQDL
jgi:hypothetical protein